MSVGPLQKHFVGIAVVRIAACTRDRDPVFGTSSQSLGLR